MAVRAECPFGSYQARLASCGFIAKRDERLPKGPRFASESLDADTTSESVSTDPLLPIWAGTEQNSETRGKSL
jgi:hypothetical protein